MRSPALAVGGVVGDGKRLSARVGALHYGRARQREARMADDEGERLAGAEAGAPPRSGGWIVAALSAVGVRVVGAVLTTVALSVGYMIFNDYVAPPPDLAGRWKFTVVYEDTALARFEGLEVTYQALLIQEGLNLSGAGEKLSDRGPDPMEPVDYTDDRRSNIELVGNIARSYFSPDRLVVHYREAGRRRQSSTLHQLEYFDAKTMCGCFQSTVADTDGSVWWARADGRADLYEPVGRPAACHAVDCAGSGSAKP
jgi:hypothetical protein